MKTNAGKVFAILALVLSLGCFTTTNTFAAEAVDGDFEIEVPLSNEGEYVHGYSNAGAVIASTEGVESFGMGSDSTASATPTAEELEQLINSIGKVQGAEEWGSVAMSLAILNNDTTMLDLVSRDPADITSGSISDFRITDFVIIAEEAVLKAATVDTTGWKDLGPYDFINTAKASSDYTTVADFKDAVDALVGIIDNIYSGMLEEYANLTATATQPADTLLAEYQTKTRDEMTALIKANPSYPIAEELCQAYLKASNVYSDLKAGKTVTSAEITTAYNDLYTAALAFDPSFTPDAPENPVVLPETSAPSENTTKTPNTGIFGSVAAQNATIGTSVAVLLAGAAIVFKAKRKFSHQTLKIRKF